jgi:hypothetical protein
MYGLTKKQKTKFVLEKIKEMDISSYEIGKKTGLSISGIEKLISGNVKNPHENTLNIIIDFLESKVLGSNLTQNNTDNSLKEPEREEYLKEHPSYIKELLKCQNESVNMIKHIAHLQNLLRNKKINFKITLKK